jgi:hypothetical protein
MNFLYYNHPILFWVVISEIVLLLLGSMFIVFLHLFWNRRLRRRQTAQAKLSKMLIRILSQRRANQPAVLAAKYRSPLPWLTVIEDFDMRFSDALWLEIKEKLMDTHLLPFARRSVRSWSWERRAAAARAFALSATPDDEACIRKLLYDKMPLVRLLAIPSAIHLATPNLIRDLLILMSQQARFTNYAYRDALLKADRNVYLVVRDHLAHETDHAMRIACLEVLSNRTDLNLLKLIESDLESPEKELRLEAVRTLRHYPGEYSEKWLARLIHDEEWEVRAIAATSMGVLHTDSLIPLLVRALSDRVWWVRLNAAQGLIQYGDRGIETLRTLDPDVDRYASDIASYVMRMYDEAKEAV